MRRPTRRRPLLVLVAATVLVMAADVAGWPGASDLRGAGAAVLGPLERLARSGASGPVDADGPAAGRVRLGYETPTLGRSLEEARRLSALLEAPATRARPVRAGPGRRCGGAGRVRARADHHRRRFARRGHQGPHRRQRRGPRGPGRLDRAVDLGRAPRRQRRPHRRGPGRAEPGPWARSPVPPASDRGRRASSVSSWCSAAPSGSGDPVTTMGSVGEVVPSCRASASAPSAPSTRPGASSRPPRP